MKKMMMELICKKVTEELRKILTQVYKFNIENFGKYHIELMSSMGAGFGYEFEIVLWGTERYDETQELDRKTLIRLGGRGIEDADIDDVIMKINDLQERLKNKEFNAEEEINA